MSVWLWGETLTVIFAGGGAVSVIVVEADLAVSLTAVAVRAIEPVAGICDGAV